MKEWLQVESDSNVEWLELAREALAFLRSLPRRLANVGLRPL
jgi:hypothetical protein